jgi:hypothetical protein
MMKFVVTKSIAWTENEASFPIDTKWYIRTFYREQIPCHNVHKIVEFCLSLPGSNAVTERIFVDMNNL